MRKAYAMMIMSERRWRGVYFRYEMISGSLSKEATIAVSSEKIKAPDF